MQLPLKKVIAYTSPCTVKFSPSDTCLALPFDGTHFKEYKGGSGAFVLQFTATESPKNNGLRLIAEKTYIYKRMESTEHRGLPEERAAYELLHSDPAFAGLKPLYVELLAISEKGWVESDKFFLTRAPGKLLADAFKAGDFTPEDYQAHFNQTIAWFITHFNHNEVSTQDYYQHLKSMHKSPFPTDLPDNKVSIEHVKLETLGKVLDRLSKTPKSFDMLRDKTIKCFDLELRNPTFFFSELQNPEERSHPSVFFTPDIAEKILMLLQPRSLAPLPTDPSPTNATVGKNQSLLGTWFDPGRIEMSQLSYPLSKHEGPFAQLFIFIIADHYDLISDSQGGFALQFKNINPEAWQTLKAIHSEPEIYKRLNECESGKELLSKKPFFLLQLIFFGWRQFGSDLVYRTNDKDRTADLCLFALGMDYISKVMTTLVQSIERQYPGEPFQTVINNPTYFPTLSLLCNAAFEQSTPHPLDTLSSHPQFLHSTTPVSSC